MAAIIFTLQRYWFHDNFHEEDEAFKDLQHLLHLVNFLCHVNPFYDRFVRDHRFFRWSALRKNTLYDDKAFHIFVRAVNFNLFTFIDVTLRRVLS